MDTSGVGLPITSYSAMGSLVLVCALDSNRIELDTPAATLIPRWRDDPARAAITIRQLASHGSGIEDVFSESDPASRTRPASSGSSSTRTSFACGAPASLACVSTMPRR